MYSISHLDQLNSILMSINQGDLVDTLFYNIVNKKEETFMRVIEFVLNNKDYLEDLITRSTYHSNAIEGSTLTYAETYAIL